MDSEQIQRQVPATISTELPQEYSPDHPALNNDADHGGTSIQIEKGHIGMSETSH